MKNLFELRGLSWILLLFVSVFSMVLFGCVGGEEENVEGLITKAELIAKIADYFQWPHPNQYNDIWKYQVLPKKFKDVKTEDPYGMQIEAAYEEGIVEPDEGGNFNPGSYITREEAAVIFVRAFKIPESSKPTNYEDNSSISEKARGSVYALVELKCMKGRTDKLFMPKAFITREEVEEIFNAILGTITPPVYALPRQNYTAPRRYVKLYCPDPDATIVYTTDGTDPRTSRTAKVWNLAVNGHISLERLATGGVNCKVIFKAYSYKQGLIPSQVQTFVWYLYRPTPEESEFGHRKILSKTNTRPAVYSIWNDSDSVRPMMWYIEGQERGILFDAGQTGASIRSLKVYIDTNIATKPYDVVIGHSHTDHAAQIANFINFGHRIYCNMRDWSGLRTIVTNPSDQAKIINIDWGDKIDLGGCTLHVYALPGHSHGNVILQDKANGLIFSSDIYGCTRAGSADNVGVTGVKTDLLLSLVQQVYSAYLKENGKINLLFTGHDETPLEDINLKLFEMALQQVIDYGEAACRPTLRGGRDPVGARTTMIGDMWYDNTRWIALRIPGIMFDSTEYLTNITKDGVVYNYNGPNGFKKYSVLSNIEFEGATLVGTKLTWASPTIVDWAGEQRIIENSLANMFDPWTFNYKIKVASGIKEVTVIPTTMSTKVVSIKVNGQQVGYRERVKVPVSNGSVITVEIVAPDGKTSSTYRFTVEVE
ncbi:MAG: S-layer homology domain-containing protein [Synergistetes bacterium]|nr:S-layer homology domain-containing protein [Synergistota bacterium]MDW8191598.1 S-layer homology domain-containing protein [Synergistota bacterium]